MQGLISIFQIADSGEQEVAEVLVIMSESGVWSGAELGIVDRVELIRAWSADTPCTLATGPPTCRDHCL